MNTVLRIPPGALRLAFLASLLALTGCATSAREKTGVSSDLAAPQATSTLDTARITTAVVSGQKDAEALEKLWRSRTIQEPANGSPSDFVVGPGDVLRISLPQLNQTKDLTVRVSENDTIALPMLGVLNVAGMSEEDLRNELSRRTAKYVYKPQVGVYLEQSENRVVAVLGAVKTPGRYTLASRSDTIMTMISRAGGRTDDAASRILLIPAPAGAGDARPLKVTANQEQVINSAANAASSISTVSPAGSPAPDASPRAITDGVVIDLSRAANQRYLALPVRSGDVIIVSPAGEVTVQGWVDKPGAFKITPGMTVLGAIAAAGGALFTSSATLLRQQGDGGRAAVPLNLARIENGAEPDLPVEGGDVVLVERSVAGAVPYSLYFLLSHAGVGFGLMPF